MLDKKDLPNEKTLPIYILRQERGMEPTFPRRRWRTALLIGVLQVMAHPVRAYNTPGCEGWPTDSEWEKLRQQLDVSKLNGPFLNPSIDYTAACFFRGQSYVELLKGGDGLCLGRDSCNNRFCQPFESTATPIYTLQAESIGDVQTALAFANEHNISVSVKSTGHSYVGASTGADSLLIWMRHFPIDNVITAEYQDSCGTSHGTTLRVSGGQNFDDALQTVRDQYHMVTGFCRTVGLGGGWLLGGGLSVTHRYYGMGLDQVRSFEVVLADGSLVTADACTNPDLFWTLRGGGAGFGIVTALEYQLHDVTKISTLEFKGEKNRPFMKSFLSFILPQLMTLDRRWAGFISGWNAQLYFVGNQTEAVASELVAALDEWYNTIETTPSFRLPSSSLVEYNSWFDVMGGDEAYENPDFDGTPPTGFPETFSRLIPRAVFEDKLDEFIEFMTDLYDNGDITTEANYLVGGAITDVASTDTSIHPAMREALLEIELSNLEAVLKLKRFLSGYETGVCYNHHSPKEPDWEDACFGSNYERLLQNKKKFDPDHRFNVYHGVGYRGPVFGELGVEEDETQSCSSVTDGSFFLFAFTKGIINLFGFGRKNND